MKKSTDSKIIFLSSASQEKFPYTPSHKKGLLSKRGQKNYHLPPELQRQSYADRRAARTGQTGSSIELCTVALHAAVRQAGF